MNETFLPLAGRRAEILDLQRVFSSVMNEHPANLQAAMDILTQGAQSLIPAAELIGIALLDGDALVYRSANRPACLGTHVPVAGYASSVRLGQRRPLRVDDVAAHEQATDPACGSAGLGAASLGAAGLGAAGLGAMVLIPFGRAGEASGVLHLVSPHAHGFDADDVAMGQLLVGILSSGLLDLPHGGANARLLEISQDRVELVGPDGRITWVNPAGERLRGAGAGTVGSLWLENWQGEHRAAAAAAMTAAREGRVGHFRGAATSHGAEGGWWDVVVTQALGPGESGELLSVARDLTDLWDMSVRASLASEAGLVIGIAVWEAGRLSFDGRLREVFALPSALALSDFIGQVHPGDRDAVRRLVRRSRQGAGELTGIFRLQARQTPSGRAASWRWVEARGLAAVRADGQVARVTTALIDIDARKRVELELAQNELTVRQVADSLPIQLVYIAPDQTFRFANRAYIGWFGEPTGGYAGQQVRQLYGAPVEDGPGRFLERALAGERIRFDMQVCCCNGVERDVDIDYIPRRDGAGEFDGCYVTAIDITRRKQEERALNHSNMTLEQSLAVVQQESERVWGLSRDLLCVRDSNWRLRSVNPAWFSALGWAPEVVLGRDCLDLIHPDDIERTVAMRERLPHDNDVAGFENRYRTHSGAYRWLSWNSVYADGFIYSAARDVTVEREAAQRLHRIEEQLRQSQKIEAVGQLTGGIAHDFNNLLTGVIGSLEMMRGRMQQGRLDELGKYMDAAAGAAERAAAVTHRLLAFSRRQALDPKLIAADRLLHGMDELIRNAAGAAATLQIVRHPGLWNIFCDPGQLEIAVLNLVSNARDAMPHGGRLVIETANSVLDESERDSEMPTGDYVAISVTDTGTGMTPEVVTRAFDPFFTTKPIGRGTGLGLSMVYGFARQSGGQARIVSAPGRGARITVYLPRAREAQATAPDPDPASPSRQAGEAPGRTVLLVEDEPMVRMLVGEALGELGCNIIEAVDGTGGMRVLQGDGPVDLLITDFGLPGGMNGLQMAQTARGGRPQLKVLFITGYAEESLLEATAGQERMQVIGKPFTLDLLLERVKALLAL